MTDKPNRFKDAPNNISEAIASFRRDAMESHYCATMLVAFWDVVRESLEHAARMDGEADGELLPFPKEHLLDWLKNLQEGATIWDTDLPVIAAIRAALEQEGGK